MCVYTFTCDEGQNSSKVDGKVDICTQNGMKFFPLLCQGFCCGFSHALHDMNERRIMYMSKGPSSSGHHAETSHTHALCEVTRSTNTY
jgi:hypothetical protein